MVEALDAAHYQDQPPGQCPAMIPEKWTFIIAAGGIYVIERTCLIDERTKEVEVGFWRHDSGVRVWREGDSGVCVHRSRMPSRHTVGLDIPRRVAPLQSPTPLLQVMEDSAKLVGGQEVFGCWRKYVANRQPAEAWKERANG